MKNLFIFFALFLLTSSLLFSQVAGLTPEVVTVNQAKATTTDVISLNAGWNLISFDVTLNPNTPAEVFQTLITANNLQMVTGFQSQQGVFFDPAGLPFLNTLQNLIPGEGYWVKVSNPTALSVTGDAIPQSFNMNLKNGWNLIGYWPQETTTPEVAFAPLITAGLLQMVTSYEQGGEFFDPAGLPFLNTLTEIKNGFGYWVKLSANYNSFSYPINTWQCGNTLIDAREGKTYSTVQIGTQCWMSQNLNVGTRLNSTTSQTENGIIEKYCYENFDSNCDVYGGLYQWDEMMNYTPSSISNPSGRQGICPPNWHVPSDAEWSQLTILYGSGTVAGGPMKEIGTNHWLSPNTGATNIDGFSALPGGYRNTSGYFNSLSSSGCFWSSTERLDNIGYNRGLNYNNTWVLSDYYGYKAFGYSVRCLKDCTPPSLPLTGIHTPSPTQIIWNWTPVTDAVGYKWNTTNDYASAIDQGASITKTETGLTCSTPYTRYVWAYNGCGNSTTTPLTQSTTMNPVVSVSIAASTNPVCTSTTVTFTATSVNGGTSPAYQWRKNGTIITGATNLTYSYIPDNNDSISCQLTSSIACSQNNPAVSNSIKMIVNPLISVGVSINASMYAVIQGMNVIFTATPTNGGSSPSYQWKVNNNVVGTSSNIFSFAPSNNDNIQCVLISNLAGCLSNNPAFSDVINMVVYSTGAACAGTPTVFYGGQTYNTVQIGNQCWLRENLNAGTMIQVTQSQSNNSIIEKYCYNNDESFCNTYGGLYNWNELMNYSSSSSNNPSGRQGICPTGWHLPSDAEWCQMETFIDPTVSCNSSGLRGTDIAGKLKEAGTTHWYSTSAGVTNLSGFTILPCGYTYNSSFSGSLSYYGDYWTSTETSTTSSWCRDFIYSQQKLNRYWANKTSFSLAARCVKDCDTVIAPATGAHTATPIQIIWNWNTVAGATGYKWNTTNNYSTATDMGAATTKTETGLTCNTAYTRYVWAYNSCGNSTSIPITQTTSFCGIPCQGTPIVTYGGQTYNTVQIGDQCWLRESLNIGTKVNSTVVQTNNGIIEKGCFNNLESNCNTYGGLYQWDEVMNYSSSSNLNPSGRQGICPTGWHIASDAEWCQLTTFLDASMNCLLTGWLGTDAGSKMKESDTIHWANPNYATNNSGFSAIPGGAFTLFGNYFFNFPYASYFWSSTENGGNAWNYELSNSVTWVHRQSDYKSAYLYSCRCLMD